MPTPRSCVGPRGLLTVPSLPHHTPPPGSRKKTDPPGYRFKPKVNGISRTFNMLGNNEDSLALMDLLPCSVLEGRVRTLNSFTGHTDFHNLEHFQNCSVLQAVS